MKYLTIILFMVTFIGCSCFPSFTLENEETVKEHKERVRHKGKAQ